MDIFIVMGTAGEYSDRREWPVAAYRNVELAQAHIVEAQKEAIRIRSALNELSTDYYSWAENEERKIELIASSPFDPDMQNDYTGVGYFLYTVKLATSLPKKRGRNAARAS